MQPLALLITTYETVTAAAVEFVNCSLIKVVPLLAASLIPATDALLQAYVVPGVALPKVYITGDPLQIGWAVRDELSCGIGFTKTVTV